MNGKILAETPFERVYIQPAAYDAGTSLGAALYVKHQILGAPRDFVMDHTYWGLDYSREACRAALDAKGLAYRELDDDGDGGGGGRSGREGEHSRLVSGAVRMGAACARQSQHRVRSARTLR